MDSRLATLAQIRKQNENSKIVFCSGGFDLTHAGHALFLEECKEQGDLLVVGIGADEIIKKEKGVERPILNESMRLKLVSSLKPVDHAFVIPIMSSPNHIEHLIPVLSNLRPDIYVVNEDIGNSNERKDLIEKYGIKFNQLRRECPESFDYVSTTKIIEKIKTTA